ncbi:hypothetical protein BJ742DRAFT_446421 [Cladochytrium replicatum]|nr:hypothetical protein BJ742DRAFT_446421 [Cladochytrium replicatum]
MMWTTWRSSRSGTFTSNVVVLVLLSCFPKISPYELVLPSAFTSIYTFVVFLQPQQIFFVNLPCFSAHKPLFLGLCCSNSNLELLEGLPSRIIAAPVFCSDQL